MSGCKATVACPRDSNTAALGLFLLQRSRGREKWEDLHLDRVWHFFVNKQGKAPKDPGERAALGKAAAGITVVSNLLLAAAKLAVGILTGAVSILADGINNLSDTAASVVTLIGFRLAQHPADKKHPYGHARYEYIAGLAVVALIFFVGIELIKASFAKILAPEAVSASLIPIVVLLASVLAKLWLTLFCRRVGGRLGSTALLATAVDCRNDVVATLGVLIGYLAGYFFDVLIDGYIGLAVALFILYSGIKLAGGTVSPLLGMRADREIEEGIESLVLSYPKILGVHDLLLHDYGPGQCYATLHAEVSAEEDPLLSHDLIDDIEYEVLKKLKVHLVIHADPILICDEERDEAQEVVTEILQGIDHRLSVHDFRLVRGAGEGKLVFDLSLPYEMLEERREIKRRLDEELRALGRRYVTVIRFDGMG